MAGKKKPALRGRGASGNNVVAGRRDSQKHNTLWANFQQPLGSVSVYDGLDFVGAVVPKAGKWLAVDANGRRLGEFDLRHRAEHAVFAAGVQP